MPPLIGQNAPKTQVVEVDASSGLLDKELPFDRTFYLKFKVDKNVDYKGVLITKSYKKPSTLYALEDRIKQYGIRTELLGLDNFLALDVKFEDIKGDSKKKYLIALCPPLPPNVKYEFILSRRFSPKQMKELMSFLQFVSETADANFRTILEHEKYYHLDLYPERLPAGIRERYVRLKKDYDATLLDFDERKSGLNSYLDFYNRILNGELKNCSESCNRVKNENLKKLCKEACENLNYKLEKVDITTREITKKYLEFLKVGCSTPKGEDLTRGADCNGFFPYNLGAYDSIVRTYYEPIEAGLDIFYSSITINLSDFLDDDCLNLSAKLLSRYSKESKTNNGFNSSLNILANLKAWPTEHILEVLRGRAKINGELNQELCDKNDYLTIQRNTVKNLEAFIKLTEDAKLLTLMFPEYERYLSEILNESYLISDILKKQKKYLKLSIDKIRELDFHIVDENIFGNTEFEKISSEAGKWILPDAGILYAFSKEADIVRPFLGVNINFGPVDKDVKSRFMPKSKSENVPGINRTLRFLRQHTSIMLGVTLGSIAIEDTRDDLFGGVNIATGLGFRVNRAIRLSSGALLYSQINPNPVISDKKTKALWYFSATFDIEFQKATQNNLSKVFK